MRYDTGRPFTRATQVNDPEFRDASLKALINGGDEDPTRDLRSRGWGSRYAGEGEEAVKMWYEELSEIDRVISEAEELPPVALPTPNLLEKMDDMAFKLESWYAAPLPVYQKRLMHHAFDEIVETSGMLKGGKINAVEAQRRFDTVMNEVSELVDFSRMMG